MLLHLGATQKRLDRLLDWRLAELLPNECYTLHDIVKDYWRKEMNETEKAQWHKAAGRWLREQARKFERKRPRKTDEWELSEQKSWVLFLHRAF